MMLQMSSRNVRLILMTIVAKSRASAFAFGFDFFFMARCILVQLRKAAFGIISLRRPRVFDLNHAYCRRGRGRLRRTGIDCSAQSQPAANLPDPLCVRFWHKADISRLSSDVRFWG